MSEKSENKVDAEKEVLHNNEQEKQHTDGEEDTQQEEATETSEVNREETSDENTNTTSEQEITAKLADINDKYVRLSAEFDNYRKRTLKERMELLQSAGEKILVNILPVMDNFERALQSLETTTDIDSLKEGVNLIYSNFSDFLNQNGVKAMECINTPFDADLHEAITKIPAPSEELKGKIVDCVQKGYQLNDKVIRYPKVVVGE